MKTLFSLIVLTTLVAQLPQLQAAPPDLNFKLIAALQRLLESQELEDAMIQSVGFSSVGCPSDFTRNGPLAELTAQYGNNFDVRFMCERSRTTIISTHSPGFVELRDMGESV